MATLQSVKITLKDFKGGAKTFEVDIAHDAPIEEIKDELVVGLGRHLGLALDPARYKVEWIGTLAEREILLSIV